MFILPELILDIMDGKKPNFYSPTKVLGVSSTYLQCSRLT